MDSNFIFDEEMITFPLEWDDPPHWVKWINDHFNECDYHVHSNNYEPWFNQVQVHLHSWVLAGSWLYKARRVRAFSHHFDSWQQFCEKALNLSQFQVNNYIKAARVFKDLAFSGFKILPKCVSQCLPLAKLKDYELTEAWQKVIDENPPHRITKNAIEATIKGEPLAIKKRLEVPLPNWEQFEQRCKEAGLNPKEELDKILGNYDPKTGEMSEEDDLKDDEVEEVDPEKIEVWEDDVKNLVNEYQVAYNLSLFSVKVILDWVNRIRNVFPSPPE